VRGAVGAAAVMSRGDRHDPIGGAMIAPRRAGLGKLRFNEGYVIASSRRRCHG